MYQTVQGEQELRSSVKMGKIKKKEKKKKKNWNYSLSAFTRVVTARFFQVTENCNLVPWDILFLFLFVFVGGWIVFKFY